MAKYYYDLHIHSILSPCADILMTPNNILNMAMLKNLDFVSITDHNSTKQLPVLFELADSYDFIIIPGIEVTVKEGFDVLCYFKTLDLAIAFGSIIENHLLKEWNNYHKEDQVITDIYDQDLTYYDKPLLGTDIPYKTLVSLVQEYNGLVVLAHIDRSEPIINKSFQINEMYFDAIELQKMYLMNNNSTLKYDAYKLLISSDAHDLFTISDQDNYLELKDKSIEAFFDFMGSANE